MDYIERRAEIRKSLRIAPAPMPESADDIEALQVAIFNLVERGDVAALMQLNVMTAGAVQQAIINR